VGDRRERLERLLTRSPGVATTRASYSDFKHFGTGVTVKVPRD
jgi:hypothetical protein